jgi:hypothetical protein
MRDGSLRQLLKAKSAMALERARTQKRIAELEAALHAAYAAMSIAHTIDAVRDEYDFEPAIRQAEAALAKDWPTAMKG